MFALNISKAEFELKKCTQCELININSSFNTFLCKFYIWNKWFQGRYFKYLCPDIFTLISNVFSWIILKCLLISEWHKVPLRYVSHYSVNWKNCDINTVAWMLNTNKWIKFSLFRACIRIYLLFVRHLGDPIVLFFFLLLITSVVCPSLQVKDWFDFFNSLLHPCFLSNRTK